VAEEVPPIVEVDERGPGKTDIVISPEKEMWRGIGIGAGLQLLAHALYAGALLLLLLTLVVALDIDSGSLGRGSRTMEAFLLILVMLLALALMTNWGLSVVAGAFWAMAPARAAARPLAIALLVLTGIVLLRMPALLGLLSGEGGVFGRDRAIFEVIVTALLDNARLIVFAFTLNAISGNLRHEGLGLPAKLLTIVTPCVLGSLFFLNLLAMLIDRPGKAVAIFVLFLNLSGQVALLVWGALLLGRLWQIIQREQGPPLAPPEPAPAEAPERVTLPRGRDPKLR
jgi:hypothetical protein